MDKLSKFEKRFGKLRAKWSKSEWRNAALELAEISPQETRGRKKKSESEKYEKDQNLKAAEFWRDQNIEMKSIFDGAVGNVQKRRIPIKRNSATKEVLLDAIIRDGSTIKEVDVEKKTKALSREIQVMQKKKREK